MHQSNEAIGSSRMALNSFPTHDVRTFGRKLAGTDGSFSAAALPISFTEAIFHWLWTPDWDLQELNKSCSADISAWHCLKIAYGIPSRRGFWPRLLDSQRYLLYCNSITIEPSDWRGGWLRPGWLVKGLRLSRTGLRLQQEMENSHVGICLYRVAQFLRCVSSMKNCLWHFGQDLVLQLPTLAKVFLDKKA